MSRIILFHWNAGEAEQRAASLRHSGHQVTPVSKGDARDLRLIRSEPPGIVIIDLQRAPSHGLAVATWLRQQRATRHIPIVFIVGEDEKTERVRQHLPDAIYTSWDAIEGALQQAVASAPRKPVIPGTMDSYRGVPLAKKLGIRAGTTIALLEAPPGFEETLGPLPEEAEVMKQAKHSADIVLLFVRSQAELERGLAAGAKRVAKGGRLWVVWPKKTSRIAGDVSQNTVRGLGLAAGWVDYKVAAIDPTWSGLCFARRGDRKN